MQKTKKRRQVIILSVTAVLVLATAALSYFIYVGFFGGTKPTFHTIATTVDNSYRNSRGVWCDAVGSDGTLFFNAYNRFPKSGIYRIDSHTAKKIYSGGWELEPSLPFSCYSYRGRLIDAGFDSVVALNSQSGEYEPWLYPPMNSGERLNEIITANSELYYTTSGSNTMYRYIDDKTVCIAASEELCGERFVPCDFHKNYMYYYLESEEVPSNVPNDFNYALYDCGVRKLYQFNLNTGETERCIDFSCIDGVLSDKNQAVDSFFPTDNYLYITVQSLEALSERYSREVIEDDAMLQDIGCAFAMSLYRYDISAGKLEELTNTTDTIEICNGYGDTVYVRMLPDEFIENAVPGSDTLCIFSGSSVKPRKIEIHLDKHDSLTGIYIFDEEWIYYVTAGNCLFRLHPDGTDVEQIF